jgi:hypothetical protein
MFRVFRHTVIILHGPPYLEIRVDLRRCLPEYFDIVHSRYGRSTLYQIDKVLHLMRGPLEQRLYSSLFPEHMRIMGNVAYPALHTELPGVDLRPGTEPDAGNIPDDIDVGLGVHGDSIAVRSTQGEEGITGVREDIVATSNYLPIRGSSSRAR